MATETRKIQGPEKAGRCHAAMRTLSNFFSKLGRGAGKPGPEPIQGAAKTSSPQDQIELNRAFLRLEAHRCFEPPEKNLEWANAVTGLLEAGAKIEAMDDQIDGMDDRCKRYAGWNRDMRIDILVCSLLYTEYKQGKSLYPNALLELTKGLLTSEEGFQNWSHTAYHFFYSKERSLLERKENHAAAEMLLEEGAKRAIAAQEKGCLSGMLDPVLEYNLSHAQATGSEEFCFKPKCFENPEFIALLKKLSYPKIVAFCESSSMPELREKLEQAAKAAQPNPKPTCSHPLEQAAKAAQPNPKPKHYTHPGLFVDVAGTLITHALTTLNQKVLGEIRKRQSAGGKVTVITGGSPTYAKEMLRELGVEGLEVKSKEEYKNKTLDELIDDKPPESQGFSAVTYRHPDELE